jgi:hypothetical protein
MANLGAGFYPKLLQMTSELGMSPEDLLATMVSESGIDPSAHNPKGASGLIQFMPPSLKGVGYKGTPEEFRQTSGEEQLQYIKRYIQDKMKYNGGPFKSAAQYYVANFWPVALKLPGIQNQDPNTVIVSGHPERDASGKWSKKYLDIGTKISADFEALAYRGNTLFDKNKKGYITYGDMITQTDQNKRNPIYQKALAELKKSTNYVAQDKPSSTRLPPSEKQISNYTKSKPKNKSWLESLEALLDKYVSMFSNAENISLKRLYKQALPEHNILIQVKSPDYNSKIEFARILTSALDEEVLSTSYTYVDGFEDVEVECKINGPYSECFGAVREFSLVLAEEFFNATKKIGGIPIKLNFIMNKKSSLQAISLKTAETNYRHFLLRLR